MAVKTEFTKQNLEQILTNYNIGQYIDSTTIAEGTVQTNYKLQTTSGQYVFRYYENRLLKSVLFETELLRYLKKNHYPCPNPIHNMNGEFVDMYNTKPFVIFEYMEGSHVQNPNEIQKKQLIQKVAELHRITKDYQSKYINSRLNYDVAFCIEEAQKASARLNTLNSKKKLHWLKNGIQKLRLPETLPKGICHADFHFSNILFNNNQFSSLLDFDDANYTYLLFDLVGLMESFAWQRDKSGSINFKEAKNVIQEYMKHRHLSQVEKEHLFDVYKLSIYIDSIWFFERGEATDFYEKRKIDYLEVVGRGNFYDMLFG